MPKLIFEDSGGDRYWLEMLNGQLSLEYDDGVQQRTLVVGDEIRPFLEFVADELKKANAETAEP
jgi:hypothetical protein